MKREKVVPETPNVWPTSKCQRALRPLKLKIAALDRSLSASHSVADGLTAWSAVISQRRQKSETTSDDSAAAYRPNNHKVRKYGAGRKQKQTLRAGSDRTLTPDSVLNTVRSNFTGAVGSAYVGVYYAFTAILEKAKINRKFPTLATRAAYAVGQCVHLTSDSFTDEPIDADNWYEAVPAHCRSTTVIGHATQLVLSSSETLQPILPAIALALKDSPVAMEVMNSILGMTNLTECRKSDAQDLQNLAAQINMSWALKIHFTREFQLEYMTHASFAYLLDLKADGAMDDATQALCLKATTTALQYLKKRKEIKVEADLKILDVMQAISLRVFSYPEAWILPFLQEVTHRCAANTSLEQLSFTYSLAALLQDQESAHLAEEVQTTSHKVFSSAKEDKQACLVYIINTVPSNMIVQIVECLVGKVDDLAIALANLCANTFEEDFVEWASNIERAVLRDGQNEKYRFEPLLDSWVAKTPAVPKRQKTNRLIIESDSEDETDEDDSGYDADQSQIQLSLTEYDCDDEDDLVKDFAKSAHKMPVDVLNMLSSNRKPDVLASAKLLKRFGRLNSDDACNISPLASHQSLIRPRKDSSLMLHSPTPAKVLKRARNTESYVVPDEICHDRKKARIRQSRTIRAKTNEMSSPVAKLSRRAQRELENLRPSFTLKPRPRPVQLQSQVEIDIESLSDELLEDDLAQPMATHVKSDFDELSLL